MVRLWGTTFSSISLALAVIAIILAGISYRFAGPHFMTMKSDINSFYPLPGLQIATLVYSFFVIFMCFVAYVDPVQHFSIACIVLLSFAVAFNLGVAVYAIVGGSPGNPEYSDKLGNNNVCKEQYAGSMGEVNYHIDTLLQQIDMNLCSKECPCFITKTSEYYYMINPHHNSTFNLWTRNATSIGSTQFQNCSRPIQAKALEDSRNADTTLNKYNIKRNQFYRYMQHLENEFECVGWCRTKYFNPNYNRFVNISKYLFSDINRGPPKYQGCRDILLHWLPGYLKAFGAITILLVCSQILMIATLYLSFKIKENLWGHTTQFPREQNEQKENLRANQE